MDCYENNIHFVLTSNELTYPYYLAIASALKYQDADRFFLWSFSEPVGEYWQLIADRVDLQIIEPPDIVGIPDKQSYLYRSSVSNLIEWQALYDYGGIYFDLDTFSLADVTYLLRDAEKDLVVVNEIQSGMFFNTCFLMARKGSEILKSVICTENKPSVSRGEIALQLNSICQRRLEEVDIIEHGILGGNNGDSDFVDKLYTEDTTLSDRTEVLHLFGGDMPLFKCFSEEYIRDSNILFAQTVREYLDIQEWYPSGAQWVIDDSMIDVMHASVVPGSTVLELGSGIGTAKLADFYNVVSIEDNPEWLNKYDSHYIHAPLIDGWYDRGVVQSGLQSIDYDAILIDGPIGSNRAGFYEHKDLFDLDCWIFVDDLQRHADAELFTKLALDRDAEIFTGEHGKKFGVVKPLGDNEMLQGESFWEVAQLGEKEWWGDCVNTFEEEQKQLAYAERMGLELLPGMKFDLNGKSVLDIGGGPISLLLKCNNKGRSKVVDPMSMPDWIIQRYAESGIDYEQKKGEDIDEHGWDEVWLYNVLLHAEDPEKIIEKAKSAGSVVRIFEWVNTTKNDMHPHVLTKEDLDLWLGCSGALEDISYGQNYTTKSYSAIIEADTKVIAPNKRFHLLGLPHVATNKNEALACAFSQKVIKMAKMLKGLGHTVFFYGVEGSEVECDEYIEVLTQDLLKQVYGDYDMRKETYKHDPNDLAYRTFNANTIPEIQKRMAGDDFLLIPFSPVGYKHIIDALDTPYIDKQDKLNLIVEMGIGYRGTYCRYRVFESVSQMHYNYGLEQQKDGRWYDAVIPNYFDLDDFEYCADKDDYFLYLGRVVHRKGIRVAVETTKAIGAKLIVAGQQAGESVDLSGDHVEYVGFADVDKRKKLLSKAKGLFLPTQYIEPFGGVIIEAMLSGTPVITSDWGAFPELVDHGQVGYRCRTLDQFVWAAQNISNIDSAVCRDYAVKNFSLDRVAMRYEEYFNMLLDVKQNKDGKGWHTINPDRDNLDWLITYRGNNG